MADERRKCRWAWAGAGALEADADSGIMGWAPRDVRSWALRTHRCELGRKTVFVDEMSEGYWDYPGLPEWALNAIIC